MAHMVVGGDDETSIHKGDDHMQVAAGMLAEAVNQLHDALGRAGRHIDPAGDLVATVVGIELDLMQHGSLPRLTDKMAQLSQGRAGARRRPLQADGFVPRAENFSLT